MCGHHGGKLHAHHILSFKEYPEAREKVENGITLCEKCHKKLHYGVEAEGIPPEALYKRIDDVIYASRV